MALVKDCGDDKRAGAEEHPVVRRLRYRRLLAFLRHEGLERTSGSMVQETGAFFSAAHLRDLVRRDQWRSAINYLARFVRLDDRRLSPEARVLHRVLIAHGSLAGILAGNREATEMLAACLSKHRKDERKLSHGTLRIHSIMLTALHVKQHLRVSWDRVRDRAAEIADDLVHRIPELKGVVLLPPGPTKTNNVLLPISSSTGQRYRRKKHPHRRPQASALAKCYLRRRESLLSSSHSKEPANELYAKVANWVADILDESLKAGKPQELHQKGPLQTSGNQDAGA